jgi:hypothetical protein
MTTPAPTPTTPTHPGLAIVLIFALVVGIFYFASSSAKTAKIKRETAKAEKAATQKAAAEYARLHPAPPKIVAPVERPWTTRTFDVPTTGLRLYLYAGSVRYPKLGGVLTQTSNGKSYVDLPGIDHDGMNNPDGWFTFLPDPLGSKRRIEIYNRW